MIEHTLTQLRHLRLDGMVRAIEEQATSTAVSALGFDERFPSGMRSSRRSFSINRALPAITIHNKDWESKLKLANKRNFDNTWEVISCASSTSNNARQRLDPCKGLIHKKSETIDIQNRFHIEQKIIAT